MDFRRDLESSNWKTDSGGVMSQQCYLAYLNLRRSEESSKLDKKCQAEIVTVRRTRRVLYRYILDNSIEETNENEKKGHTLIVDSESQDIPRIVLKRKKLLKNISITPNSIPENNYDTPSIRQSRKKISENDQLQSTLKSQNECTNLQHRKDNYFVNDSSSNEKTLNNFGKKSGCDIEIKYSTSSDSVKSCQKLKQSDVSRSQKQPRKRPKNISMSDSHKIVCKKRKIVSGFSVTKNIKIEDVSNDNPRKIRLENKGELNISRLRELPSLLSYSPKLVVAEESKDELGEVVHGSCKSQNINNNSKKCCKISDNFLPVPTVKRVEPNVTPRIEMPFNTPSSEQSIHSLTIEEQLHELLFPRECMGEIDHFVPVPHIEIEIETSEIIPIAEGALHYSFSAPKINKQIINDSASIDYFKTTDFQERETVSNNFLQSYNQKQQGTYDNSAAFKHNLEHSDVHEYIAVDTIKTKKNSQETLSIKEHFELEHDCLPRPIGMEVRSNKSSEKISNIQKSNTRTLKYDNSAEVLSKTQRFIKDVLKHNIDDKRETDSLVHSLDLNIDQCQKDSRISEHPAEHDTDQISKPNPAKKKRSTETAIPKQPNLKNFTLAESNNGKDMITKGTLRMLEHSLETNKDRQKKETQKRLKQSNIDRYMIRKDDKCETAEKGERFQRTEHSEVPIIDEQQIIEHSLAPSNDDQHRTRDNFRFSGFSLERRHPEQQMYTDTLRIAKYDECHITKETPKIAALEVDSDKTESLPRTEPLVVSINDGLHIHKPSIEEQYRTRDILKITDQSLEDEKDEQHKETEAPIITEHCAEPISDNDHITKKTLRLPRLEMDNDEQHINRESLSTIEHPMDPNYDELQRTIDNSQRLSPEVRNNDQDIERDSLRILEHSIELYDNEQHLSKEALRTPSDPFIESKNTIEPRLSKDHIEIDAVRNDKHLKEMHADEDKQHIITDNLGISEHSVEALNSEQDIKNCTSITNDCLELSSMEELVTNYANQLQIISSPQKHYGIQDSFFPELHVELEVEINEGVEIDSKIDKSLLNSHEEEILNDTSMASTDVYQKENVDIKENFSLKPIFEEVIRDSPSSRKIEMKQSPGKEPSYCSRIVRMKEQLENNFQSPLGYREVDSGEPCRIEVIHYKPTNYFQRKYCTFCKVGFLNGIALEKHMSECKLNPRNVKMGPAKIFYCKICNFGITDEVFFRQHERKCQKEVICRPDNSCSNPPIQETGSKSRRKRSKIGRHKCPNCQYTSDNIGHMSVHRRIHDKTPLCVCDVCKKGFTRLDALKLHMFRHIDVAKEVFVADKVSVWNGNASKSILEVNIKNKEFTIVKYQCSRCKYATPVTESMEKHINSIHLNLLHFKCHLCSFTTKLKSNLKQHLNWHSREKTYKCSYCSYETINKTYIKHHQNQVHLRTVSFKCDLCDFVAYRKENLKTHVHSIHLKTKKYPCKKCDYFSYVQSNLIAHVKSIHEGIKRKYKRT